MHHRTSAIIDIALNPAEMLAGRDDDKAVARFLDQFAGAQMVASSPNKAEERSPLDEFIQGQLIPIPVEDGNCPEMTVHAPHPRGE